MRGAWYVVEVFCGLSIYRALLYIFASLHEPVLLALTLFSLSITFTLAILTLKGKRLPRKILSAYILVNAVYAIFTYAVAPQMQSAFKLFAFILSAYLIIGAILLWRIKELPTRFTDPPAETPPHA